MNMTDFLVLRDSWRDALLKEYETGDGMMFPDPFDDGTMLEVNVDTGDDDECCEMIKQKYADVLSYQYQYPRKQNPNTGKWEFVDKQGYVPLSEFSKYNIDCNRIRQSLERNAYRDAGTDPAAKQMRKDHYAKIIKEWDECEKSTNSWKNELR